METSNPKSNYRLKFDFVGWIKPTVYYKIQRRGWLGIFYTIADGQTLDNAEKVITELVEVLDKKPGQASCL